jgi:hypothetical protein
VNRRNRERKQLDQRLTLERWDPNRAPAMNVHLEVQGVDISSGGVGISAPHAFRVGEVVKIEYVLNGGEVTLPLFSEIVWSVGGHGMCRTGLRFLI